MAMAVKLYYIQAGAETVHSSNAECWRQCGININDTPRPHNIFITLLWCSSTCFESDRSRH
ncbi:hypothetical protein P691DRAFT_802771 [Macrolepiota fuliginosa MF-IS2]|uniref:Uncharacterized protein n=1 Tax=Macrolepiota fuliginosa MF-IS2 TaxID=1400762 RepID=A0A9P5XL79_9AGAR|nr:hypothetical protein P691DRAFT_802771 [Macrolepiota fuliginosa MF-IS2]